MTTKWCGDIFYTLFSYQRTCAKKSGVARSDYDYIHQSMEDELNEWGAERGYAELARNRNCLAEVITFKLQDSFYINVSWDVLNTAYREHLEWVSELVYGDWD